MLTLAILIYAAVLAFALGVVWRRRWDPLHPVALFLIYLFIQLGLSNVLYVHFDLVGELSLPLPDYSARYFQATLLAIGSTVLVAAGSVAVGRRCLAAGGLFPNLSRFRTATLAVFLMPAGFAAFYLLLERNGGAAEFFLNREAWRAGGMIGQGILLFPCTVMLNLVALLDMARTFGEGASKARKAVSVALLLLSVAPATLLGFRGVILIPLLQGVVLVNYLGRGIPTLRILTLAGVAVGAFTVYGLYRELASAPDSDPMELVQLMAERPELAYAAIVRSRGADVVANVIDRLAITGEYDYGTQSFVEWITIWIPSAVWEDKPVPSGMRFTTYFFGETLARTRQDVEGYFGGISPTFVGESYWHLGLVGVAIFSFLWGMGGQLAYNSLARTASRPTAVVAYAIFWSAYVMSAETIQGYANTFLLSAIALALLLFAARRSSRLAAAGSLFTEPGK